MTILFINLSYHGHAIPTIGLVQELIKAGHQVTCLMPQDWESKLQDSGADFLGYENNPKLDKEKCKLDQSKRQTWGELNPVTRKPENSKAYNRNTARNWHREYHETSSGPLFYTFSMGSHSST